MLDFKGDIITENAKRGWIMYADCERVLSAILLVRA